MLCLSQRLEQMSDSTIRDNSYLDNLEFTQSTVLDYTLAGQLIHPEGFGCAMEWFARGVMVSFKYILYISLRITQCRAMVGPLRLRSSLELTTKSITTATQIITKASMQLLNLSYGTPWIFRTFVPLSPSMGRVQTLEITTPRTFQWALLETVHPVVSVFINYLQFHVNTLAARFKVPCFLSVNTGRKLCQLFLTPEETPQTHPRASNSPDISAYPAMTIIQSLIFLLVECSMEALISLPSFFSMVKPSPTTTRPGD